MTSRRAGHRAAIEVSAGLRYPRRHRHCARRRHPTRLRLDGRQDHRVGPGPQRSTGSARAPPCGRPPSSSTGAPPTSPSFSICSSRDEVVSASADTGWLDRTGAGTATGPTPTADIALIAAAVDAYEAEESRERSAFLASARGGRPRASHAIGQKVELNYQGQPYSLNVGQIGPHAYRVVGDGGGLVVEVERLGEYESRLSLGNQRFHIVTVAGPTGFLVEVDGISHRISQDEAGLVRAASGGGCCHAGGRGRRGRGRRHPGGPGEHEDGNRAAGTGRGARAGDLRRGQQPGRFGCGTAALRSGR